MNAKPAQPIIAIGNYGYNWVAGKPADDLTYQESVRVAQDSEADIDFDEDAKRRQSVQAKIPADLQERVFVIGVWSEPERLKTQIGSYERIGAALAEDCFRDTNTTWSHPLLEHNTAELVRLREQVRPFLFEPT